MTSDTLRSPRNVHDFILQELKEYQEQSEFAYIQSICRTAIQIHDGIEKCKTYDKDATKPLAERACEFVYLLACTVSHNAGSVNRNPGTPVEELERAERRILLQNNLQREGEKLSTVLTEIKEFVEWLPSRYFITTWLTTSNSGKIHAFMARLYEALEDFKAPDEAAIRECVTMLATINAIRRPFPPEEQGEMWNIRVYMHGLIGSLAT